ncbi:MAG: hypothetical protein HWE07_02610 [Cytophagia bacterium]|nr:hypothetical protein [Cytophagia bacterium]
MSEGYISNLIDEEMRFGTPLEMVDKDLQHLDSLHTDLELMEVWNRIYDKYGCRIPQFEERWYRDNGIGDFGDEDESSELMGERIEEFLNSRRSKNELIDLG